MSLRTPPVGIRAETMHRYERRAPIIPEHMKGLIARDGLQFKVQRSPIRLFTADQYRAAGAEIVTELGSDCPVLFGVKQVPHDFFKPGHTYVMFGHVTKGQTENMVMLDAMMRNRCNYIDYEYIVNSSGERQVAYGRFAGIAGMTDTLNLLGERLKLEGIRNPFEAVRQTIWYPTIQSIKTQLAEIGRGIATNGLPEGMPPMVVGFTGHGRCSGGAEEIFDQLGAVELTPSQLLDRAVYGNLSRNQVYKVTFDRVGENGRYERTDGKTASKLDLDNDPQAFQSSLPKYLDRMTMLVHTALWQSNQPTLVSQELLLGLQGNSGSRLKVFGDISCDPWNKTTQKGPMACTLMGTKPEAPYYVYNPQTGTLTMGIEGIGFPVNAVETMPCEVAYDASLAFSSMLTPYVPGIARADWGNTYNIGICSLPEPVRPAVVLWEGRLTPRYESNQVLLASLKLNRLSYEDVNA
jgi:alpha-aminoadipic semialdehyde synthase